MVDPRLLGRDTFLIYLSGNGPLHLAKSGAAHPECLTGANNRYRAAVGAGNIHLRLPAKVITSRKLKELGRPATNPSPFEESQKRWVGWRITGYALHKHYGYHPPNGEGVYAQTLS